MSVHTFSMCWRHSCLLPVVPSVTHPAGGVRSANQIEYWSWSLTTTWKVVSASSMPICVRLLLLWSAELAEQLLDLLVGHAVELAAQRGGLVRRAARPVVLQRRHGL